MPPWLADGVGRLGPGACLEGDPLGEEEPDDLPVVRAHLLADHDTARQSIGQFEGALHGVVIGDADDVEARTATTACSTSSGVVVLSPLHMVCECRSTRTHPGSSGATR